ncbi:DUF2157 domain-containing protein [Cellulosilyticum sp. I15G10I2]|uniref:DUF2157 domain-containing protein n=1 Tax=Cellulosilyticum sp. I15G10I2 TaxID=1892843 RepID=UPI00085BFC43|nr:DUF2157 domain-containing protein [Cellulosilyticum sp. I15G10I2]
MVIFVLWMISPIILGIWLIITASQKSKLNRQMQMLTAYLRRLYEEEKISKEVYHNIIQRRDSYGDYPSCNIPKTDEIQQGTKLEPLYNGDRVQNSIPSYQPSKKSKKPISTINIVLIIGVLFIILSGLIFATTTWKTLPSLARTMIVFSLVIVFFTSSWIAENKLKLKQTSVAFYTLGSIFLPITMIAVGYFRLLGDWFTLYGEGRYLLALTAFLLLALAAFIGGMKYQSYYFVWTTFGCVTLSFMSLIRIVFDAMDLLALGLAIYSSALIILSQRLTINEEQQEKTYTLFLKFMRPFSMINLLVLAVFGAVISGMGILSGIAMIIFAGIFLNGTFYSEAKVYGIYPFTVTLMVGFVKLGASYEIDKLFLMMSLAGVMIFIFSLMNLLNNYVKRALNIAAVLIGIICLGVGGAAVIIEETWTLYRLAAAAIVLFNMTWGILKYKNKPLLYMQPVVLITLLWGSVEILLPPGFPKGIILSLATVLFFGIYYFLKVSKAHISFRTRLSDGLFVITSLWGGLYDFSYQYASSFWSYKNVFVLSSFMIVCVLIGILSAQKEKDLWCKFYALILPHTLILMLLPIREMVVNSFNRDAGKYLFLAYVMLLTLSAVCILILQHKYSRLSRYENPFGAAVTLYTIAAFIVTVLLLNRGHYPAYLWLFTLYWGVRYRIEQKKEKGIGLIGINSMYYVAGTGLFMAVFFTARSLFTNSHIAYMLCAPAALSIILFGVYLLGSSQEETETEGIKNLYYLSAISLYLLACINTGLYILDQDISSLYVIVSLVLIVLSFGALYLQKNTLWSILPLTLIYPVLYTTLSRLGYDEEVIYMTMTLALFIFLTLFSRMLCKQFYALHEWGGKRKIEVDWLAVINITAPFYLLFKGDQYWRFAGCILMGLYILSFYSRFKANHANKIIFTAASICVAFAYWMQPFIVFHERIETELNLLPLILIAFLVQKVIWKGQERVTSIISLAVGIFCLIRLGVDAVIYENDIDTLIIALSALGILLVSFYLKRKRWFVLSAVTLVVLALYMSKSFWMSLAWWIYLLGAGIILISIAAVNERIKGKSTSLVEKVGRFMSDWSW